MATILIVDDDAKLVEFITRRLGAQGHRCLKETTAEGALELVRRDSVDLVILDIMMPGMSGFELCRRIHADTAIYRLRILILSAMNAKEEIAHGLAQGADDYLTKPFDLDMLISRVQNLLESSEQDRMIDDLTSLPGPRYIKLEIQKAITMKQSFAVAYGELVGIGEFGRVAGAEARAKALRHLARAIHLCGKELAPAFYKEGHMGGGYFVCLLEAEKAETFCKSVYYVWENHLSKLYTSLGMADPVSHGGGAKNAAVPVLKCLFSITACDPGSNMTFQDIFEVLTRLRQKALASKAPGMYVDLRN